LHLNNCQEHMRKFIRIYQAVTIVMFIVELIKNSRRVARRAKRKSLYLDQGNKFDPDLDLSLSAYCDSLNPDHGGYETLARLVGCSSEQIAEHRKKFSTRYRNKSDTDNITSESSVNESLPPLDTVVESVSIKVSPLDTVVEPASIKVPPKDTLVETLSEEVSSGSTTIPDLFFNIEDPASFLLTVILLFVVAIIYRLVQCFLKIYRYLTSLYIKIYLYITPFYIKLKKLCRRAKQQFKNFKENDNK
jgi:hypothetical protein